jgi:signal transduction histidine kinase
LPVTQAIWQRKALWLEKREDRVKQYPAVTRLSEIYPGAWAILPLLVEDRALGAMNFAFDENREFGLAERAFMVFLSYQCAQALERVRLYEQAQEAATLRERQRIARELHDAVSQTLFSANMIAEALPLAWERNPDKTLEQVQLLHQLTRGAAAEMRTLLTELRPDSVVNARLEQLLKQLAYAMQGRKEMSISVIAQGESEPPLPAATQLVFYRVAQESLNNIMKHGQATQARIRLTRWEGEVKLVITDNGRGFDVKQALTGLGLSTMRERAESIGAWVDIRSIPDAVHR